MLTIFSFRLIDANRLLDKVAVHHQVGQSRLRPPPPSHVTAGGASPPSGRSRQWSVAKQSTANGTSDVSLPLTLILQYYIRDNFTYPEGQTDETSEIVVCTLLAKEVCHPSLKKSLVIYNIHTQCGFYVSRRLV